jgi:stress-induced morphogen
MAHSSELWLNIFTAWKGGEKGPSLSKSFDVNKSSISRRIISEGWADLSIEQYIARSHAKTLKVKVKSSRKPKLPAPIKPVTGVGPPKNAKKPKPSKKPKVQPTLTDEEIAKIKAEAIKKVANETKQNCRIEEQIRAKKKKNAASKPQYEDSEDLFNKADLSELSHYEVTIVSMRLSGQSINAISEKLDLPFHTIQSMLNQDHIKRHMHRNRHLQLIQANIDGTLLLRRLNAIATYHPGKVLKSDKGEVVLRDDIDFSAEQCVGISKFKRKTQFSERGSSEEFEIAFADPIRAIETIAKLAGLFDDDMYNSALTGGEQSERIWHQYLKKEVTALEACSQFEYLGIKPPESIKIHAKAEIAMPDDSGDDSDYIDFDALDVKSDEADIEIQAQRDDFLPVRQKDLKILHQDSQTSQAIEKPAQGDTDE